MTTSANHFDRQTFISEIVSRDYRTAAIFLKHRMDFWGGEKWTLEEACARSQVPFDLVKRELERTVHHPVISNVLRFGQWDLGFLAEYIIHVHHDYIRHSLPGILEYLQRFAEDYKELYPYFSQVVKLFERMYKELLPHLSQEEEIIFPYIRQISYAFHHQESYAALLVRTLKKPVTDVMTHGHELVTGTLSRIRELTKNYDCPDDASRRQRACFALLLEVDNNLVQHMHLENNILFPKAIKIEKALLDKKEEESD
jgi:regulator of cell morphogenesis and NO signaling